MDVDTARKRAGAISGFSGLKQPELAAKAGLDYAKWLKPVLSKRGKEIDTEELVRLAEAAGVPSWFARDGWAGAGAIPESELADRLRAQEALSVLLENRIADLEEAERQRAEGRGPATDPSP